MNKNVITFGDSIMFGIVVNPDNMRYVKPKEYSLHEIGMQKGFSLTNLSKMGRDSKDGLKVVKEYIESHGAPEYAVVEYGGNDCTYNWSELSINPAKENGRPRVELLDYVDNLKQITTLLQENGSKVYYMNLPPIDSERHLDWIVKDGLNKNNILSFLGSADTIKRVHSEYNAEMEKLAKTLNVQILDVREKFNSVECLSDYISIDGVHPSRIGLKLIQEEISEFLDKIS